MTRLLDMGIEDYLLTSTLKAVLAQRLVRRLCAAMPDAGGGAGGAARALWPRPVRRSRPDHALPPDRLPACRGTGFRGRRAIAELLVPSRAIDRLIFDGADDTAIERAAVESGMRADLRQRALGGARRRHHDRGGRSLHPLRRIGLERW